MDKKREIWVDDVKVFACILVVFGHLMQALVTAQVSPDNDIYRWFNKTIYYFHVPLFFICSGYLYQKLSSVRSLQSWGNNVKKKAISLGIPYFTFTVATWLLKIVFSGAGNNEINNIVDTLFFHPTAPYWYLYTLFFIFLITPTFNIKQEAISGFIIALIMKLLSIATYVFDSSGGGYTECDINSAII
ncbi:MAG: acyltransferase [Ruminococcus sp.]|nr:acyltransferase [Ruminococcus sp.]